MSVWTSAYFNDNSPADNGSELPVLIVGMPRSGTSLVEQILASHPAVHGGGELPLGLPALSAASDPTGNNPYHIVLWPEL